MFMGYKCGDHTQQIKISKDEHRYNQHHEIEIDLKKNLNKKKEKI